MANIPFIPQPRQVLTPLLAGPWVGVRDAEESGNGDPRKAFYAQNVYPQDLRRPSPFVGRPGVRQAGDIGGSSGFRTGQLVAQFTETDGTEHTIRIVGGQFYTYDWELDVWTEVLDAADFSGASITLDDEAPCYAVNFNGQLIVSDGVNTPWAWDGTTGGGLTSLTNAPVAYGQPTVYAAKLFFIKATEPTVIVWSEENQANVGYEAGGYNNAWALTQTDNDRLFAITGSNEALDVFRANSTTSIYGAVTPDFATAHTREIGSETMGTKAPQSLVLYDKLIFFMGEDHRPHVRVPGAGVVEIFDDCQTTSFSLNPATVGETLGIWDPVTELVLFAVCSSVAVTPDIILAFNPKVPIPQFVGVWAGWIVQAWGVVKDGEGRQRLMHLSDDGYAYYGGFPSEDSWTDELAAGDVAIEHIVESPTIGFSHDVEKTFLRADMSFQTFSNMTNATVQLITPTAPSGVHTFSLSGGNTIWDSFFWDEDDWSGQSVERKYSVGFFRAGRWCRWRIIHNTVGERFGLSSATVIGAIDSEHPEVI